MAEQPNILVIWGDDIGSEQPQLLQRRLDGVPHAEHRPDRRRGRAPHRLLHRAGYRRTRGLHLQTNPIRTGLTKVGLPRGRPGLPGRGPYRHRAQGARLRDGAVGQEPPRATRTKFLPEKVRQPSATSTTSMPRRRRSPSRRTIHFPAEFAADLEGERKRSRFRPAQGGGEAWPTGWGGGQASRSGTLRAPLQGADEEKKKKNPMHFHRRHPAPVTRRGSTPNSMHLRPPTSRSRGGGEEAGPTAEEERASGSGRTAAR